MNPRWILLDGYSVLHAWTGLPRLARRHLGIAPGPGREQRRQALLALLQQYADHRGVRLSVVFDGYAARARPPPPAAPAGIEVVYSREGKTADDFIERCVGQTPERERPSILVVTADNVERGTVESLGARTAGVESFAAELDAALRELDSAVRRHQPRRSLGGIEDRLPGSNRQRCGSAGGAAEP